MKAGQSKSMRVLGIVGILALRVLGIVGIVAFIGFWIMRYEMFVEIMNNPGNLVAIPMNDLSEVIILLISYLLLGGPVGGA